MKQSIFVVLSLFTTLLGMAEVAADQAPRGHFTLTGVEVSALERTKKADGKVSDHKSDTLTHWIRFDVETKADHDKAKMKERYTVTNPIDKTKSRLTVDKPIKLDGKEIPAGTNLLDYKKFDGSRYNVSMPTLTPLARHSIYIRGGFYFPPDKYTLKFEWEAKDGTVFSDSVTVNIDIKSQQKTAGKKAPSEISKALDKVTEQEDGKKPKPKPEAKPKAD